MTARFTEFYVISRQQLQGLDEYARSQKLVKSDVAPPPPHNEAIDAVLNTNKNSDALKPIKTFLESLPASNRIRYNGISQPLYVDRAYTQRKALFYIKLLATLGDLDRLSAHDTHDVVRLAAILQQLGMPISYIKNQELLTELNSTKGNTPYDFNTWHTRA